MELANTGRLSFTSVISMVTVTELDPPASDVALKGNIILTNIKAILGFCQTMPSFYSLGNHHVVSRYASVKCTT